MGNLTPLTMPRLIAAWSFLRARRLMVIAFAISVTLHLSAWLATPYFIQAWHEPAAAKFDAVLVSASEEPVASSRAKLAGATESRRAAKTVARRRAPSPPPATFSAPEGAIAIDRAQEPADDITGVSAAMPPPASTMTTGDNDNDSSRAPVVAEAPAPVVVDAKDTELPPPELPARISIAYKMTSTISDGVADYKWTRDGDRFEIDSTMQATGFIVGNFVGVLHQVSEGVITSQGLKPGSYRIRRGDGPQDTAEFLTTSGELKLTRAGDARVLPLPPRIQDMQSFLFQLAFDAPKIKHADDRLEVLVTNARKVYRHRFQQIGVESVKTRAGTVEAVHLRSEANDPEDTYEVWLAPESYHLPVKIRFFAGRFPVELIATSIRTAP